MVPLPLLLAMGLENRKVVMELLSFDIDLVQMLPFLSLLPLSLLLLMLVPVLLSPFMLVHVKWLCSCFLS